MPPSEKGFLGEEMVRHLLDLLSASEKNDQSVVGLVVKLDDLVSKWDRGSCNQATSDQAMDQADQAMSTDHLIKDILIKFLDSIPTESPTLPIEDHIAMLPIEDILNERE